MYIIGGPIPDAKSWLTRLGAPRGPFPTCVPRNGRGLRSYKGNPWDFHGFSTSFSMFTPGYPRVSWNVTGWKIIEGNGRCSIATLPGGQSLKKMFQDFASTTADIPIQMELSKQYILEFSTNRVVSETNGWKQQNWKYTQGLEPNIGVTPPTSLDKAWSRVRNRLIDAVEFPGG